MMEDFKIIALVGKPGQVRVVLNRKPNFVYERNGNLLYAVDGPLVSCFKFDRPSKAFRAFAGAEFDLPMTDGSVTHCYGQWWDGGSELLEEELGYKVARLARSTIDELKSCYVFTGGYCNKAVMERMIEEYEGCIYPYWDYEKVITFDDMRRNMLDVRFKLERDKKNLIKQCKRLKSIIDSKE